MADLQSILVVCEEDGRKFKMVMRGDVNKLSVSKIKRYLHKSTGAPPEQQALSFGGKLLTDEMLGEDFGLHPNATLRLALASEARPHSSDNALREGSYARGGLEIDGEGRQRQLQQQQQQHPHPAHLAGSPSAGSGGRDPRAGRSHALLSHPQQQQSSQQLSYPSRASPTSGWRSSQGTGASHWEQQHVQPSLAEEAYQQPAYSAMASRAGGHVSFTALEEANAQLLEEVHRLRSELATARDFQPAVGQSMLSHAKANLVELGKDLGMHLAFDVNLTCVVGADERNTILITFDAPTERLYLYSTLLNFIPDDVRTRMQLYETLLEGAMLGRDMAGGGCGISLSSGIVLMSTSIDLKHCNRFALRDAAPPFVECLLRWRGVIAQLVPLTG